MTFEYIAGFFDGEGCISKMCKRFSGFQVIISQKEKYILDEIQNFLLTYNIRSAIYPVNKKSKSPVYSLVIRDQQSTFNFLSKIISLIYIKKEKAVIALNEAIKVIERKKIRKDNLNNAIETFKQGFGCGYIYGLHHVTGQTLRKALIQKGIKPRDVGTNQYTIKKYITDGVDK